MKRVLSTILALVVVLTIAKAQVGEPRCDVAIGISGGATMNTVSFQPSVTQLMKLAPMYGLVIRYNCEKYFASLCGLQMEVNYQNLGWEQDFSETATPQYFYKRDVTYVNVPIMARMAWGRERKGFMGYILAGPQIGFMLDEKESMSPELIGDNPQLSTARRSQYGKKLQNSFDYGITAGAGMEWNMGKAGHLTLQARYYLGLADVFNNGKADYFSRSANNTISVNLAYLFDIIRGK